MEELIRVARIGRSLGVHLILATQKPAGIVDDQIRSNSRFSICLKVNDKSDSNDVIKRPDAANLKRAGQFYLQVGNDEYFVLGQSAWSGAQYFPSDMIKKKVDTSICFISDIGKVIKEIDNPSEEIMSSSGEQLTNVVKYLYDLAKQEKVEAKQLWLDSIPETIYIEQLRKKYCVKSEVNNINPVIGEYDDPFNQRQEVLNLPLSRDGNTIIYGNADSGKETLLSTIVYDIITTNSLEEIQLYLLDFGSEALKIYKECPHVGDVVYINDTEKIARFFDMIEKEMKDRRRILSDYNGEYELYLKTSDTPMPMIIIMMNNYEAFFENYESEYEDRFLTITREARKYGIVFIITASTPNMVRYRLAQNFKQKIALQLNNEDDYTAILDNVGKKRPSRIFGRGLVNLGGETYEFQAAKICEAEKWNEYVKETIEKLKEKNPISVKAISVLPNKVAREDVQLVFEDLGTVPIGIAKNSLSIYTYNFKKNFMSIITSKSIENAVQFTSHLLKEIEHNKKVEITIFDAEKLLQNEKMDLKGVYNNLATQINDAYSKEDNEKRNHTLCVIIGLDKFLNEIKGESEFSSVLEQAGEIGEYSFIIVENATRLKTHEYDEWYKEYVVDDNGIWIGNGVADQYVIKLNRVQTELSNSIGTSFGYVINQGNPTLIKLLEMNEDGDENE